LESGVPKFWKVLKTHEKVVERFGTVCDIVDCVMSF